MLFEQRVFEAEHFHAANFQSSAFEARQNLADEPAANSIGFKKN
jgi:hypothetical protein